ncbi:MAG: hypothetical protein HFE81_02415 [Bacilli bacterium]|nr:hypothetical protein [Bacilli bacterium]
MSEQESTSLIDMESILKTTLNRDVFKVHKLKSNAKEILVVSQKGKNESYNFFEPSIEQVEKRSAIKLKPIEDIFDYLEERNVDMNVKSNKESEELYARIK